VTEELEVLAIVTRRLDSAGFGYMVTGSIAGNYYAVPRMTRDVDLVIALSPADADRVCALFEPDFDIEPTAVRAAIADRTSFNAIHTALVVKVDFVVRKDSPYRLQEWGRRRRVAIDDAEISMVASEDLIISKLDWARDTRSATQLADVRNLLAAVPDLDRDYLHRWVSRLGLDALYREAGG
jgi:hypothetical protein